MPIKGLHPDGPVKLCCGKRHHGPVCPDGKVQCCLCYNRVEQDELNVLPSGMKEDCCKECADKEAKQGTNHDTR